MNTTSKRLGVVQGQANSALADALGNILTSTYITNVTWNSSTHTLCFYSGSTLKYSCAIELDQNKTGYPTNNQSTTSISDAGSKQVFDSSGTAQPYSSSKTYTITKIYSSSSDLTGSQPPSGLTISNSFSYPQSLYIKNASGNSVTIQRFDYTVTDNGNVELSYAFLKSNKTNASMSTSYSDLYNTYGSLLTGDSSKRYNVVAAYDQNGTQVSGNFLMAVSSGYLTACYNGGGFVSVARLDYTIP